MHNETARQYLYEATTRGDRLLAFHQLIKLEMLEALNRSRKLLELISYPGLPVLPDLEPNEDAIDVAGILFGRVMDKLTLVDPMLRFNGVSITIQPSSLPVITGGPAYIHAFLTAEHTELKNIWSKVARKYAEPLCDPDSWLTLSSDAGEITYAPQEKTKYNDEFPISVKACISAPFPASIRSKMLDQGKLEMHKISSQEDTHFSIRCSIP